MKNKYAIVNNDSFGKIDYETNSAIKVNGSRWSKEKNDIKYISKFRYMILSITRKVINKVLYE